jgi:hypothetical protein
VFGKHKDSKDNNNQHNKDNNLSKGNKIGDKNGLKEQSGATNSQKSEGQKNVLNDFHSENHDSGKNNEKDHVQNDANNIQKEQHGDTNKVVKTKTDTSEHKPAENRADQNVPLKVNKDEHSVSNKVETYKIGNANNVKIRFECIPGDLGRRAMHDFRTLKKNQSLT